VKINHEVYEQCQDQFGEFHILDKSKCPKGIQIIAERILKLVDHWQNGLGEKMPRYNTMTELDKIIILEYWKEYDGITIDSMTAFESWFLECATFPDMITRAFRILVSHHYVLPRQDVLDRAQEAGANYARRF
jgi:hypothetical protein